MVHSNKLYLALLGSGSTMFAVTGPTQSAVWNVSTYVHGWSDTSRVRHGSVALFFDVQLLVPCTARISHEQSYRTFPEALSCVSLRYDISGLPSSSITTRVASRTLLQHSDGNINCATHYPSQ